MAKTAKFLLDKPKSSLETLILLYLTCDNGGLKYSTKRKALPLEWDAERQRPTQDKATSDFLDTLNSIVNEHIQKCTLFKEPVLTSQVREALDQKTNNRRANTELSFYDVVEIVAKKMEGGDLLTNRKTTYSLESVAVFKRNLLRLQDFDPKLNFSFITLETIDQMIIFYNRLGWAKNSVENVLASLKNFLRITYKMRYHKNTIFQDPNFKIAREMTTQVYLTLEEIQTLLDHDFSYNRAKELIRDRFVLNLFMGLRASDIAKLTMSNFFNGTLQMMNQKTGNKVVVPIHPIVTRIIDKYNGQLPRNYNKDYCNTLLKDICREAGFTQNVMVTKTIGGKKQQYIKEKWQLISLHTCRRSLVSNLLKYTESQNIKTITGMTMATINRYDRRSAEENAEMLKSNPFFAGINTDNSIQPPVA